MFDIGGCFFSNAINRLAGGLTVCCKSLILLEIFFSNDFNRLRRGSTSAYKSLISKANLKIRFFSIESMTYSAVLNLNGLHCIVIVEDEQNPVTV